MVEAEHVELQFLVGGSLHGEIPVQFDSGPSTSRIHFLDDSWGSTFLHCFRPRNHFHTHLGSSSARSVSSASTPRPTQVLGLVVTFGIIEPIAND